MGAATRCAAAVYLSRQCLLHSSSSWPGRVEGGRADGRVTMWVQVERCWMVTRTGLSVELAACIDELPAPVPTVQLQSSDRQITTRTAGSKVKQVRLAHVWHVHP